MEPPEGGAGPEHQLPGADLQDSGSRPFPKMQPLESSGRTSRRPRNGDRLRVIITVDVQMQSKGIVPTRLLRCGRKRLPERATRCCSEDVCYPTLLRSRSSIGLG